MGKKKAVACCDSLDMFRSLLALVILVLRTRSAR
jgi:hypothetical protein